MVSTPINTKETAAAPSRLPALTGMRALAAASVFLFHVWVFELFASPGAQGSVEVLFGMGGFIGVSFFFVLSGFVLTYSMRAKDTKRAFWRRRILKIYPNNIITIIAALVLTVTVAGVAVDGWTVVLNMLLIHVWFPDPAIAFGVNLVSWTLAAEALFYLLFPLLLNILNRIRPERLWAWCGVVVAVIWALPLLATLPPDAPGLSRGLPAEAPEFQFFLLYIFPVARIPEFILGILLARIVMTGRKLPVNLGGAAALTALAIAVAPAFPSTYQLVAIWVIPLGLVVAAGAAADIANRPTFLSSRVMVWLGEVSFAFYLWHYMVLKFGQELLGGNQWSSPVAILVIVLLFGVSLLLSWLLFSLVENPIMRRFGSSRRQRRAREEAMAKRSSQAVGS